MQTLESKRIEDYLHLYLGCEIIGTYDDQSGGKGYLTGVTNGGHECEIQFIREDGINVEEEPQFNEAKEVKLILRQLGDMTDEERAQKDRLKNMEDNYTSAWEPLMNRAESIRYLLSKHFDLFGLIPAGLAIDKTQKQ